MFYLISQSFPGLKQKILDRCEHVDEILPLLACYLRKTKGQLVIDHCEMQNEGVHIMKVNDRKFEIYQTRNTGILRNCFYYEHVLTYSIVEYTEPCLKVAIPQCKTIEEVLLTGRGDIEYLASLRD